MFDLPGRPIERDHENFLRETVASMCGLERSLRFPGSQPISFKSRDIDRLQTEDYWVCEKSDGIRILLLIIPFPDGQEVYVIDRKNIYRQLQDMFFPHYANKTRPLGHTLVDGELVLDKDPAGGGATLRLYAFDCLVCDGQNIMSKPLQKRYGRLKIQVLDPFLTMLKEIPDMINAIPFRMVLKHMELAYAVEKVVREDIPKLHHESDGLIYTNAENGYAIGTDRSLLKWKAPSENSIDFKLELKFPPLIGRPNDPDFAAKPVFKLLVYCGDDRTASGKREGRYEYFDLMDVPDEEWEQMKDTGQQYDDRIVEVSWDKEKASWHFLRFRDDKPDGNHFSVVQNIIESIIDGVEVDELLSSAGAVKAAWKSRENMRAGQPPPPPPPPHGQPPISHNRVSQGIQTPIPYGSYLIYPPDAQFPEDDIHSSPLYNSVSGPISVDGILR